MEHRDTSLIVWTDSDQKRRHSLNIMEEVISHSSDEVTVKKGDHQKCESKFVSGTRKVRVLFLPKTHTQRSLS